MLFRFRGQGFVVPQHTFFFFFHEALLRTSTREATCTRAGGGTFGEKKACHEETRTHVSAIVAALRLVVLTVAVTVPCFANQKGTRRGNKYADKIWAGGRGGVNSHHKATANRNDDHGVNTLSVLTAHAAVISAKFYQDIDVRMKPKRYFRTQRVISTYQVQI